VKLYNLAAGMNPLRLRIFMAEKGIEIPLVDLDMMKGENRTPEFLAKNPLGTLPVLELDDGTYLAESVAICRYFEELHPNPPLFGTDTLGRAQVEMWNRRAELELFLPAVQAFQHANDFWKGRVQQVPEFGEMARTHAQKIMAWLNDELADREFLAGDTYTIADITAQCGALLAKNTGTAIPDDLPHFSRWFAAVTGRPTARG
jgi:glutathione S-transferase